MYVGLSDSAMDEILARCEVDARFLQGSRCTEVRDTDEEEGECIMIGGFKPEMTVTLGIKSLAFQRVTGAKIRAMFSTIESGSIAIVDLYPSKFDIEFCKLKFGQLLPKFTQVQWRSDPPTEE